MTEKNYAVYGYFYLTKAAAEWLKSKNMLYVGSIQKHRYNTLCLVMDPELEKSRTSCIAYNSTTGECVVFFWSANKKMGGKYVHTNTYKLKIGKKDTSCAPVRQL